MAHPNRKEGIEGHNAKLRRMTRGYGDANLSMKKNAPVDVDKTEGPEEVPEFGADSAAPNARADRPARRTMAANPMATYKHGGKVKHHGKAQNRAHGGRTGKGKTNININVMPGPGGPQGQNGLPPPVVPVGGNPAIPPAPPTPPGGPPMPLMAGGPGMMPPGGGLPPGAMPPGMMPPRKRGGRVQHSDVAEDKSLVRKMVKGSALKRAKGGGIQNLQLKGNKVHMDDGAESGPGRLEKSHARARNAKHEHPQSV